MNALSLWQPWASAIAVGLKSIETRHWPAPRHVVGEPLAIAAAVRDTPEQREFWNRVVRGNEAYYAAFAAHGYRDWADLPFGEIVCLTEMVRCVSTNDPTPADLVPLPSARCMGNFSADRFAWFLKDVQKVTGQPVTGRQGIFHWSPLAAG